MNKKNRALGARIKAALKASGYRTIKEFSDKHNIPYLTVSQHIQGRRYPAKEFISLYSKVAGVTRTWLETGEGSPLASDHIQEGQAEKIDEALLEASKKLESNADLDVRLLTIILEQVAELREQYQLDEKRCATIAANLYTEVTQATQEKALQEKMIAVFIKTYKASK